MTEHQQMHDSGESRSRMPAPEQVPGFRLTLEHRLRTEGLEAALAMLNQRTRFRFTGLYRVVPPELHNVALYDRENPMVAMSGAICGLTETYCSIVHGRGRPFRVGDAPSDSRLRAHPAREAIQSYAGVPVRRSGGAVLGTLCHFDGRPRIMPASELAVLGEVAPLFAPWLTESGMR
jgi:GAF domain-containing protein